MKSAILTYLIVLCGLHIFFYFAADGTHDQEHQTKLTLEQQKAMCKAQGMVFKLGRDSDDHYCVKGSRPWEGEQ